MKLIALLAGCLIAAPLNAYQQVGDTFKLSAAEVTQCAEEGGCIVATEKQIAEAMYEFGKAAFTAGLQQGQATCGSRT
jgi:hypothetical protein